MILRLSTNWIAKLFIKALEEKIKSNPEGFQLKIEKNYFQLKLKKFAKSIKLTLEIKENEKSWWIDWYI